ncbi:hypothetical protein EJB05_47629 [Eragrostis curvula]|uniref:Bifunctional inhibitor/plant lipid transfer protein/seed storage helical domain-containing protein n=1 Tax=Eragrostis curvula TaxID=38414 RepID=A0A5J9SZN5_9POAL|nr:hypothetical protein EJB05_47629 [Eragrostis curvula]
MAMKAILQFVVLALVFDILTSHQALAEEDCHGDKELVKVQCRKTLEVLGPYVDPKPSCIRAVEQSDIACICRIITPEEEIYISIIRFLRLACTCHKPVPSPGQNCGTIAGATLKITSMRVLQGKQSKEGSWK